jgi:hypothetical protein
MKKTTVVALTVLVLALVVSGIALAADAKAAPAPASWKGEIVDIACYSGHGAKGAGHGDCAKKCAKAGQPMGLMTGDGDLYLLAADHSDGKAFEAAKDMAGSEAEVTGTMAEKSGIKVITVTGVKKAA